LLMPIYTRKRNPETRNSGTCNPGICNPGTCNSGTRNSGTRKKVCWNALRGSFVSLALLLPLAAAGQTLARPGWAGSGLTLEPWWIHAVLYEIDPHHFQSATDGGTGTLRGIIRQLDYVHSLGVDAITLTHVFPAPGPPARAEVEARLETVDPALGTLDDFDDLVREASRDGLRVVLVLDAAPDGTAGAPTAGQQLSDPAALATVARFWLSRGVAGISLRADRPDHTAIGPEQVSPQPAGPHPADPQQNSAQLHTLHSVTRSFAGQRILIAEALPGVDRPAMHRAEVDLVLDPTLAAMTTFSAVSMRPALERLQPSAEGSASLATTDGSGIARSTGRYGDGTNDVAIAKVLATILLATRTNAQLYFGQEIGQIGIRGNPGSELLMPWGPASAPVDAAAKKPAGTQPQAPGVAAEEADPDSLLNWYRQLIDLHHGNAALRSGTAAFLNHDADNSLAWVIRKQAVTPLAPAVVVLCNLSAQPVTLSLTGDMRSLHLRGSFLRTILRSDKAMGGVNLNAVKLPPYGVYIGELRF